MVKRNENNTFNINSNTLPISELCKLDNAVIFRSEIKGQLIKATENSACYDIISNVNVMLLRNKPTLISTGLYLVNYIPSKNCNETTEIQIRSRSSMAINGIMLLNGIGTIDLDYRNEIKVPLINLSNNDYRIEKGNRIAQLNIIKVIKGDAYFINGEFVDKLVTREVKREGGFGSTGI